MFLIDKPKKAKESLMGKGIRIIDSTSFNRARHGFLRIMIGTREENRVLVKELKKLLERFKCFK